MEIFAFLLLTAVLMPALAVATAGSGATRVVSSGMVAFRECSHIDRALTAKFADHHKTEGPPDPVSTTQRAPRSCSHRHREHARSCHI